jgi:hypothetical protein
MHLATNPWTIKICVTHWGWWNKLKKKTENKLMPPNETQQVDSAEAITSLRSPTMSRLFVEARAPISLNFFSSVCKRRSISPVWAEANWPNLDELDITVSFFLMSFVLKKRQLDPICSRILRGMMMTGGRPTRLPPATPGGQEHGTGRLWEPALRNSAPVNYPRMAETVFRPPTLIHNRRPSHGSWPEGTAGAAKGGNAATKEYCPRDW